MKKLIFTGCSFTSGSGWDASDVCKDVADHPNLWTNLVFDAIPKFANLQVQNHAQSGASNTEIFENTIEALSNYGDSIHTLFCQWTSMPRYNFTVGFELWNTKETFNKSWDQKQDVNLNRGDSWSREYIDDLVDRIRVLHHLHWEILKVVRYTNVIKKIARQLGITVFFINGLCPWDRDYFKELKDVKPESYTKFTKVEILNIDTRDDEDIYKLYSLAHQHYQQVGGIDESDWINLYDSYRAKQIDFNYDQQHPGTQSNQNYCNLIVNRLKQLNFI